MTKEEFTAAAPDAFFVFTAHLLKTAFNQNSPQDQAATFAYAAKDWTVCQGQAVQSGIVAISPDRKPDSFGRGAVSVIATKAAAQRLFDAFSGAVSFMSFAEYSPPPAPAPRTGAPSIRKR